MAVSYRKRLEGKEREFVGLVQASSIFHAMDVFNLPGYISAEAVYKEICSKLNIPPVEGCSKPLPQSGSDLLDQLCGKLERIAERYATSQLVQKAENDKKDAKIEELERKLAFYERGKTTEFRERILRTNQIFDNILAGEG